MDVHVGPSGLSGGITAPPSKSAAHRAIIAAALAGGTSVIDNVDLSSDIRATIGACEALGCRIAIDTSGKYAALTVDGGMSINGSAHIDCAESGSTLRFFIPIACALPGPKVFTGHGRLPHRPIDAYYDIFTRDGIVRSHPDTANLPLTVSGTLSGGDYTIDGSVSSQYITGLLFALPLLAASSTLTVTGTFASRGYVDMTLRTLKSFGIDIACEGNRYIIKGGQKYMPQHITVEGDDSQAAFFIVGGALAGDITLYGLHADSLQPDRVAADILGRMGADITRDGDALHIKKSALHGTDIDVSQCPDLVPPLAVAAALADGVTHITGAARLRIKESDRLAAMSNNLARLGISDHRITMAFAIAALTSTHGLMLSGAACIDKSYPGFFQDLAALGGNIS
jgi:3-phosphoshikimate 1-carboxyvinyltransferase